MKRLGQRLFGGYAELLRIPHTLRISLGAILASYPFPMIGMTITIMVAHYYSSYTLAGTLSAIQAIALAIIGPVSGKLADRFGQRQVSIPMIVLWTLAATSMVTAITHAAPIWLLYLIAPFLACIPPWGGMVRSRWTTILRQQPRKVETALSLASVFDEFMWLTGNPLGSILAVISGVLSFSFVGVCVIIGSLMFLTELTTEPQPIAQLARQEGLSYQEYQRRQALTNRPAGANGETAGTLDQKDTRQADDALDGSTAEGSAQGGTVPGNSTAAGSSATPRPEHFFGPGMITLCITFFGLGLFQSAVSISVIAFARESNLTAYSGLVFACWSLASLLGATLYGAKHWVIPLWKRFYVGFAVLALGMSTFIFAKNLLVIGLILLVVGSGQAPTFVNGNQLLLHLIPRERFTEGNSWLSAMNSIGGSVGAAVAGFYIDRYSSHGGFIVAAIFALAALAMAFVGFKQIRASSERPILTEITLPAA